MGKTLTEIIIEHEKYLKRHHDERNDNYQKIKFCREHNFAEEERILHVKNNAINEIIFDYKTIIEALKKLSVNS